MKTITIGVRSKIPRVTSELRTITADNSEYKLVFDFDEDWEEGQKLVFLIVEGVEALAPIRMDEDEVTLPPIRITDGSHHQLAVGVQQGEILTTRPVRLPVYPSVETALMGALVDDERVTMTWLDWVNQNMAAAETNVETAQAVLAAAQAAAAEAEMNAESAAIDAAAAKVAAQTLIFPVFWVDVDGHVKINRAERLGTSTFRLTAEGHLEVNA